MPSTFHEVLVSLFRNRPTLAPELLGDALGVGVPAHSAIRFEQNTLSQVVSTEYRADLVLVLEQQAPVFGIVVEVQLSPDAEKRFSWPVYATELRARLRAPTCVLVVAPDRAVAAWARTPIDIGAPGSVITPVVLGPDLVPWVTDPKEARRAPELAVLSVLAHGKEERGLDIALAVIAAAAGLDTDRSTLYTDLAHRALNAASRAALEELMESGKWEWSSPFAKKYVALGRAKGLEEGEAKGEAKGKIEGKAEGKIEGKTEGKAEALLAILAARGLVMDDEMRARIFACADDVTLDRWIRRAATATSLQNVVAVGDAD